MVWCVRCAWMCIFVVSCSIFCILTLTFMGWRWALNISSYTFLSITFFYFSAISFDFWLRYVRWIGWRRRSVGVAFTHHKSRLMNFQPNTFLFSRSCWDCRWILLNSLTFKFTEVGMKSSSFHSHIKGSNIFFLCHKILCR